MLFFFVIVCLQAQISNKLGTQTITTAAGNSNEINTLMTNIIQSPTHSLQNQAGKFSRSNPFRQKQQQKNQTFSISNNIWVKMIFVFFFYLAGTAQAHKSNSNAAIISLLNSAPAAMTSSAVVNSLNTPSNSPVTIPIQRLIATHTSNSTDNLQQQPQQVQMDFILKKLFCPHMARILFRCN